MRLDRDPHVLYHARDRDRDRVPVFGDRGPLPRAASRTLSRARDRDLEIEVTREAALEEDGTLVPNPDPCHGQDLNLEQNLDRDRRVVRVAKDRKARKTRFPLCQGN